jgi:hypothetical protein
MYTMFYTTLISKNGFLLIKAIQRSAPMNAETQCGCWRECHSGVHRREDEMRCLEYIHERFMNLAKQSGN